MRIERERETRVAVKKPIEGRQHWLLVLLSWAGYLLEFASMLVQVVVVVFVISPPSEGLGFVGLALVKLIYYSLFLIVPATLVAMVRATAIIGWFDARSNLTQLIFHGTGALLPFAVYALLAGWRVPDLWTPAPERLSWRVQTPS